MAQQPLATNTKSWYLIGCHGESTVRIRPHMLLGATPEGNLSFEESNACLQLDIADDGELEIRSLPGHLLQPAGGNDCTSDRVPPDNRVELQLPRCLIQLDTDISRSRKPEMTRCYQVVESTESVASDEPDDSRQAATDTPLVVRAMQSRASPRKTSSSLRALLPTADQPEASTAAPTTFQEADDSAPPTESAPSKRPGVASPRRFRPTPATLFVTAIGLAALMWTFFSPPESSDPLPPSSVALQPVSPSPVESPLARPEPTSNQNQDVQPVESDHIPEAVPDAPRPIAAPAIRPVVLATIQAEPALAPEPSATDIELANSGPSVPLSRTDNPVAVATPPVSESADPVSQSQLQISNVVQSETAGVIPPSTRISTNTPTLNRNERQAVRNEEKAENDWAEIRARARDLREASEALENGHLVEPVETSAYTLYSRILERYPDSKEAARGIQSVREALVNNALAALAAGQLTDAQQILSAARSVGVNPGFIENLEDEVEYRRRVQQGQLGRFESLYPAEQLTSLTQEAPNLPRNAFSDSVPYIDVAFTVTEMGEVQDIDVQGDVTRRVKRTLERTISRWRFEPVLFKGRPVPVRSQVRFTAPQ